MKTTKIFLIVLTALLILAANGFADDVTIPNMTGDAGATIDIPVNIDSGYSVGVIGYQFTITYNHSVLNCTTALKGSLTNGTGSNSWDTPSVNATVPGQIIFLSSVSDTVTPLNGAAGSLALIRCTAVGSPGASTSVEFGYAELVDQYLNQMTPDTTPGTFIINPTP